MGKYIYTACTCNQVAVLCCATTWWSLTHTWMRAFTPWRHKFSHPHPSTALAVCCSVLQCVAVCCSVLQCVAVCCIDWCCFYYFVRNSQVALLETLCASVMQWVATHPHPSTALAYREPRSHHHAYACGNGSGSESQSLRPESSYESQLASPHPSRRVRGWGFRGGCGDGISGGFRGGFRRLKGFRRSPILRRGGFQVRVRRLIPLRLLHPVGGGGGGGHGGLKWLICFIVKWDNGKRSQEWKVIKWHIQLQIPPHNDPTVTSSYPPIVNANSPTQNPQTPCLSPLRLVQSFPS